MKLELDPTQLGAIHENLRSALQRAARAENLDVAEAILRRAVAGTATVVRRTGRQISIYCSPRPAEPIFYASIADD